MVQDVMESKHYSLELCNNYILALKSLSLSCLEFPHLPLAHTLHELTKFP